MSTHTQAAYRAHPLGHEEEEPAPEQEQVLQPAVDEPGRRRTMSTSGRSRCRCRRQGRSRSCRASMALPSTCLTPGATSRRPSSSGRATRRLATLSRPPSCRPPSRSRSGTFATMPSWPPSARRTRISMPWPCSRRMWSRWRAHNTCHEELNRMHEARHATARKAASREVECGRDAMRRAASALWQERHVRSCLAQAAMAGEAPRHDDEAGRRSLD